MVYEAPDGEKLIKFDELVFKSIGEVNEYIKIKSNKIKPRTAYEK